MSLTLKIGSLAIRTFAKPVANYIKRNAHEHDRFRRGCISFAQRLHRIDMRLRLGLLQDPAVIERQIQREIKDAEAKRLALQNMPTVKTESETLVSEEIAKRERQGIREKVRSEKHIPRIRPLSEAKAIETGANFMSEAFMFLVAGAIIVFESWRSRRKELNRRDMVADRLEALEAEKTELQSKIEQLEAVVLGKKAAVPSSQADDTGAAMTQAVGKEPRSILASLPDIRKVFSKRDT
ncbi:hypothetical protein P152DRAFT_397388 [Eremomyces bilateralis CBS 781.70]|uniref:OPA3-domain-containing protein n=1 Tax=Eremomyces bilateralis CBS 781.70 TaxID=1392243 RepID=A0A6G1G2F2_9PEZI|nr:uncharacterized protein P152DRAFT_397388 [Eremomyces bilateralis CBS 781.70]KAF1812223.1 hypothetical protein P152DRAFT_397388 [Eremomyces bilateralis CBS 781.70]